jgi:hypothetical protein
MTNKLITLLNKIPGVNIKKIENFALIGELAEEAAREMENQKGRITELYERQKDRVRDELSAQISSIRQQYELGLISRDQYQVRAEQYQAAAQEALVGINEKMEEHLKNIEANTYAALSETQRAGLEKTGLDRFVEAGTSTATLGFASLFDDSKSGLEKAADVLTGGAFGFFKGLLGFASGASRIPFDMPAYVHQGEGIIPKTFNEGIQRGDYALVGGRGSASAGSGGNTSIYVTVNVEGNVIKNDDLAAEIHAGISKAIVGGRLAPLPA